MSKEIKLIALFLTIALLSGCINSVSVDITRDKDFELSDIDKVKKGMEESEVVRIFGRPDTFGIDDDGNEYLKYEVVKITETEGFVPGPFVGIGKRSLKIKGFALTVFIKDGLVNDVESIIFPEEEQKTEMQ